MNKTKTLLLCLLMISFVNVNSKTLQAQTIADFESLNIPIDSFWNGSDGTMGFANGNAWFTNMFTDWGGGFTSWSGFSYSNMRDTVTQDFINEYSAVTSVGYNNSPNYAVCYISAFDPLPRIRLNGIAKNDTVDGFYITNSSYSYLTMKNGSAYSKKFGGSSGNDPDWFALSVSAYSNGVKKADSVLFYLADFRFPSASQDYLIKNWQWIDLTSLGKVDSLEFKMFSSDTGSFGINTPTYFCMDNLITNHNSFSGMQESIVINTSIFPNPAEDYIMFDNIDRYAEIKIYNVNGNLVKTINMQDRKIDISNLDKGLYLIRIINKGIIVNSKFIKH